MSLFPTVFAISSLLGPIPLQVVIREKHISNLAVTRHAIETGAEITDHSYIEPKKLILEGASGAAAAAYNALVQLQKTRQPFSLVTGLYVYNNMLIEGIEAERDSQHGRILNCRVELTEILLVSVQHTRAQSGVGSNRAADSGKPGGAGSTNASAPTPETASSAVADQVAPPLVSGDAASGGVQPSLLKGLLN